MGFLLSTGTSKLGASIFGWSIPAIQTCPGRTPTCSRYCYATHGRFVTDQSRRKMQWRYAQSKKKGFAESVVEEAFRRGVLIVRVHVSGDFYSPGYASKWVEIVSRSPGVRFFGYTRSYRVPKIEPVLRTLASLPNMRLWYSADRDCYPDSVPQGVKVAYMQSSEGEQPKGDLVFQVRKLRQLSLPLAAPVCGQETELGKSQGVNCSNCRACWE